MRRKISAALIALTSLAGCATTKVETSGSPPRQALCQAGQAALATQIVWLPQWRPDQKEPALREAAALRGIEDFARRTSCLAIAGIHRLPADQPPTNETLIEFASKTPPQPERLILVVVRELGPRLSIGLPMIVEGGTEVVIEVRTLNPRTGETLAHAQTRWQNGGSFVIKGVKTLDQDMSAALTAALMPEAPKTQE